jgi:hypothetical protein
MARNERAQGSLLVLLVAALAETITNVGHSLKEGWDDLHIGRGHFMAWVREGFKELTHMLLPAFPGGQHVIEEPGLFGNPTQGEVAKGRQDSPGTYLSTAAVEVSALNEEPVRGRPSTAPSPAPSQSQPPAQSATGTDIVEQARSAGQAEPGQDTGPDQSIERDR